MKMQRLDCDTIYAVELLPAYLGERIALNLNEPKDSNICVAMKFNNKAKVKLTGLTIGDKIIEVDLKDLEVIKELKMIMEVIKYCVRQYLGDEQHSANIDKLCSLIK